MFNRMRNSPRPFDTPGALGFDQFTTKIGADWNHDAVVLGDRKRRTEIERIAGFRAAGGDAVLQNDRESSTSGNIDALRRGHCCAPQVARALAAGGGAEVCGPSDS